MDFLKKIFGQSSANKNEPQQRIRITADNLNQWENIESLVKDGKVKFDSKGRLRYLHGAPVGDMFHTKNRKDGTPIYQELADVWFDPESPKAKEFVWP